MKISSLTTSIFSLQCNMRVSDPHRLLEPSSLCDGDPPLNGDSFYQVFVSSILGFAECAFNLCFFLWLQLIDSTDVFVQTFIFLWKHPRACLLFASAPLCFSLFRLCFAASSCATYTSPVSCLHVSACLRRLYALLSFTCWPEPVRLSLCFFCRGFMVVFDSELSLWGLICIQTECSRTTVKVLIQNPVSNWNKFMVYCTACFLFDASDSHDELMRFGTRLNNCFTGPWNVNLCHLAGVYVRHSVQMITTVEGFSIFLEKRKVFVATKCSFINCACLNSLCSLFQNFCWGLKETCRRSFF